MKQWSRDRREEQKTIAFVPTMGFLHKGHLTLMETALKQADVVVASIFVNPTQFGPNEDLDTYPRALERDLQLCRDLGVAAVFTPGADDIYPEGFQTYITLERLPFHLCGLSRPSFFRGVCTVVTKLFNIVNPHMAVFGEKDFQQLTIIRRMVRDLCMDIEILGVPTVREPDGLAMSSRNKYLADKERPHALLLNRSLAAAQMMVNDGTTDSTILLARTREMLETGSDVHIDYINICDPDTLDDVERIDAPALMAMAVILGKTRLIDNRILTSPKA